MDKFAKLYFHPGEADLQRQFLLAMNGAEIIQISEEEVDRWYQEELNQEIQAGCENTIVLHNDEEVNRFKYVMRTFFKDRSYDILDEPVTDQDKNVYQRLNERRERRNEDA